MSELMQLLTGAKPYPIPACAIRPMPFDEDIPAPRPKTDVYCSKCNRDDLTEKDFHRRADGRLYRQCKQCMNAYAKQHRTERKVKCA